MRRFGKYPIVVNYNLHTQLRSWPKQIELHEARQYEKERQLHIKTTTTSDATIENNLWKKEIDQYELTICKCLQKIESNPVGSLVLGLINKQTTVWIEPKRGEERPTKCTCAQTAPVKYEIQPDGSWARGAGFGDTVIDFMPELGDDTLFHELVHAYRYSYKKFSPLFINVQNERLRAVQSTEEFFAHQMENIYMSQANRPLGMDYTWAWPLDKKAIYDFLLRNGEMLGALRYFLRHEYLAMLAAHTFSTDYNPFRDFATLEKTYVKGTNMTEAPEPLPN